MTGNSHEDEVQNTQQRRIIELLRGILYELAKRAATN